MITGTVGCLCMCTCRRRHTQAYRPTRACAHMGVESAHTHSQLQYFFLNFMVKISHFSRQRALRSLHPPNSPQPKPQTDWAVTLCFQKRVTKIREVTTVTHCCSCNALLTSSYHTLHTTAVCSSLLRLLHLSSLWSIRACMRLKVASGCTPGGCQRMESDTSQHC